MTQTVILAVGITDATSSDIVVTSTPVTVGIYGANGTPPNGYDMQLVLDTPVTGNALVYDRGKRVNLTSGNPSVLITAPGTYRIVRKRLESTSETIGAYTET